MHFQRSCDHDSCVFERKRIQSSQAQHKTTHKRRHNGRRHTNVNRRSIAIAWRRRGHGDNHLTIPFLFGRNIVHEYFCKIILRPNKQIYVFSYIILRIAFKIVFYARAVRRKSTWEGGTLLVSYNAHVNHME